MAAKSTKASQPAPRGAVHIGGRAAKENRHEGRTRTSAKYRQRSCELGQRLIDPSLQLVSTSFQMRGADPGTLRSATYGFRRPNRACLVRVGLDVCRSESFLGGTRRHCARALHGAVLSDEAVRDGQDLIETIGLHGCGSSSSETNEIPNELKAAALQMDWVRGSTSTQRYSLSTISVLRLAIKASTSSFSREGTPK